MVSENTLRYSMTRRHLLRTTLVASGAILGTSLITACADDDPEPADPVVDPDTDEDDDDAPVDEPTDDEDDDVTPADPDAPVQGGTLRIGIRNYDYDTLDPHVTGFRQVYYMIMNMVDPLVWLSPDLSYAPGLALSWDVSDDATVWSFELRDDVTFHDGTQFDAEAVQFNLDRMVDPATASRQAGPRLGSYEGTDVVDEFNIEVRFADPFAVALNSFSQHFLGMVSPSAVEEHGEDFAQHIVGTGPFAFESEDPQVLVRLLRNPDYNWGPSFLDIDGPPYLDAVEFQFIPEDGTRLTTLRTGETNIIDEIPVDDVAGLQEDEEFQVQIAPLLGICRSYHLNVMRPPTDELAVRQAMSFAVDRSVMEDVVFRGIYPQVDTVLVPGTLFFHDDLVGQYAYDPDRARELLEEAGWVEGSDGIREKDGERLFVRLATFPGYVAEQPSELAQAQFREIGLDFEINVMTGAAMMQDAGAEESEYNVALSASGDPDPGNILFNFYHTSLIGVSNYAHFSDERMDELLEQGLAIADEAEREAIYHEVQQIIMDEALAMGLYANVQVFGARAGVHGLRFDPRSMPMLYDIYITED